MHRFAPSGTLAAVKRRSALLAVLLVVLSPWPAEAHLGHLVLSAERYLKIDAAPHEARVVVSLMLGPTESPRVLREADTSHDGNVDEAEATAYVAGWARELQGELPITVDDAPAAGVAWRDGAITPLGPVVTPEVVSVEVVAHVPLAGGEHTLRLRDRMDATRFDRTDIAITARDGAALLAAGAGRTPRDVDHELWFPRDYAPTGGRWFTARVRTPADPPAFSPPVLFVAGGVTVVGVIALLVWRRKRG